MSIIFRLGRTPAFSHQPATVQSRHVNGICILRVYVDRLTGYCKLLKGSCSPASCMCGSCGRRVLLIYSTRSALGQHRAPKRGANDICNGLDTFAKLRTHNIAVIIPVVGSIIVGVVYSVFTGDVSSGFTISGMIAHPFVSLRILTRCLQDT